MAIRKEEPVFVRKTRKIVLPSMSDIHKPPEDFTAYTLLLYGAKGSGKTTGTLTFPNAINFQWEPMRRNVLGRIQSLEFLSVENILKTGINPWMDFIDYLALACEDDSVSTIVIDTVDIAYEACQEHHCVMNGVTHPSMKKDFGKTWTEIRSDFTAVFRTVVNMGKMLVFTSHAKEREQELMDGFDSLTMVGPSCAGSCGKIMKQLCDYWFYYGYHNKDRYVTIRDLSRSVEVACGFGFQNPDGSDIERILIPNDPSKFFDTLNNAFKGNMTKKTVPIKKVPVKKLPVRK